MLARLDSVGYTYPGRPLPALEDVELEVRPGELNLVVGPSGGGKSTLLRVFNGLVPHFHGGRISGSASVAGLDVFATPPRKLATTAGMVFQQPEAQGIAETVIEEVAFGLEQRAVPRTEMVRRCDAVLGALRIGHLRERRLSTLSGGERQRVAAAAALVLEPPLLLLDEPTSQLDPAGAAGLLDALLGLRKHRELAVLIAEHRLDRLFPAADRLTEVREGRVRSMDCCTALQALRSVPTVVQLCRRLGLPPKLDEACVAKNLPRGLTVVAAPHASPGSVLVAVRGVSVAYGTHLALRNAEFDLRAGEVVALVGPNGSGKSTLFRALSGLSRPATGSVTVAAGIALGLVPQDPAAALYRPTATAEVSETLALRRLPAREHDAARVLERWGLTEFAGRDPRDVSIGQQERVATAAMLAHEPHVWLLDEPTRGADAAAKDVLLARLAAHSAAGGAAIVATHDLETAARFATRVIGLEDGEIAFDLGARAAFGRGGPLETVTARIVPGAISPCEVQRAAP